MSNRAPSSAKIRSKSAMLQRRVSSQSATKRGSLRSQRWKVALTSSRQAGTRGHHSSIRAAMASQRASRSAGVVVGSDAPSTGTYGFGLATSSRRNSPTIGQKTGITSSRSSWSSLIG